MASRNLPPSDLVRGIRAGDRATLARAITLIESKRGDHRKTAHHLVQELLPLTGRAVRLGITGAPGVGKSTTIDVLGTYLTGKGHKVAVLAVDPSSTRTAHTSASSITYTTRLPSATATGAAAMRSGPCRVKRRTPPFGTGCIHSSPSVAAYTIASPAADQHQQPPPIPRPGRGGGYALNCRCGAPSSVSMNSAAVPPAAMTNTTHDPSGLSRGSVRSRETMHRSTAIVMPADCTPSTRRH